ncbi:MULTISPECIES: hypothetical protein [Leptospira]|uniref:hypothetical protein n=1 Tax=Leptospira TaxID=171 RepID=UPI0002785384|nr:MULTISPECIES: hypothetical protein [Leptospira]EJO69224.1 hypothetical protein LEP1GSC044_2597 [Leptospira kirschneri serovar Grippotyphosa str. RM52]EKQ82752.1 hypothetical protein LEP1GSC064_2283 [Leptospira kirschneri serovar Grippotyphosa str. Moskva]EKR07229.1 hypothetical protein LEP1GSC122_2910 [Leptospira kirschneri serovar Valbuzzi str. 200702274]EMK02807.1 hypothetical protein LEP1GSC176_0721 [Leptospira kirschneri str. MMD1493]EMO74832.1 hypothetical protein LEP1GSC127_1133 [Lept
MKYNLLGSYIPRVPHTGVDGDKAKASFGFATSGYLKTDERIFYLEDLSPPADWNLYLTQP